MTATALAIRPMLKGWSHIVAAVAAVVLCPIMIALSPSGTRAATSIYTGCVIALFAISGAYHRVQWGERAHQVMRSLDHSMIFVVIAATYTPVAAVALPRTEGTVVLALVWSGAAAGVLQHLFWRQAPRWISIAPYLLVGWVALVVIVDIWRELGVAGFVLLLAGGLMHSLGAVVYARRRPDPWPAVFGFHEVFHVFVILGIACHYVVVAFFAVR